MAKFCTKCGNELGEQEVICQKCGNNIDTQVITKESKSNGMATVGFILSLIFPLEILGLIFSIIGLSKSKIKNRGKGLSIAGIIISISSIFLIPVIMVVAIPSVIDTMNTARQKSYENSLMVIEENAQLKYNACKSEFLEYSSDVFDPNTCQLSSNYSNAAITESGMSINDIAYVTIKIIDDEVQIVDAADGTGKFEGAKFSK